MRKTAIRAICSAVVTAASFWLTAGAAAQIVVSPDVSMTVGGVTFIADEHLLVDDLEGSIVAEALGPVPSRADVVAVHRLDSGDQLFTLASTTELPGAVSAEPRDVVRYDGVVYTLELVGSAIGIPTGTGIDALTIGDDGNLVVSFDATVSISTLTVDPGDLVQVTGPSLSLVFDASSAAVPRGLNLDAAHLLADDDLLVSFDGSGQLGLLFFDDEDILRFGQSGWTLEHDLSALHGGWSAPDVDALFVFEATLPGVIFTDSFESGDATAWSSVVP